jgi:hypothetical protein
VARFRIWLTTTLAFGVIVGSLLHAQVGDEEKSQRDESEQSGRHASPSPKPKKSPSPAPKVSSDKSGRKHRPSATPEKAPRAIPHAKLANEESEKKTDHSSKGKKSPTPNSKAKPAKKSDDEAEATPKPTPRETPESASSRKAERHQTTTNKSAKKKSHDKEVSGKSNRGKESKSARKGELPPEKTPRPAEERAAASEHPTPAPKAVSVAAPTPAASPESKGLRAPPGGERAQVVIEKSGLEEDQGLEPPPSPPPRRGFWPWSRSSSNYRYLTGSVIDAIRHAPVKRRRWQFIVVHNSGTRQGNARVFDYYHRHVRRMQNGLAYHFVIGNGTSTGNGQIEVGDRWRRQINGGHVHSDYLNNISLGICLVGDFNRDRPTRAQLDACEELIRYLRARCGKTDRGPIPVRPHREMNPPRWPTDCPGDDFPYSWFRRF